MNRYPTDTAGQGLLDFQSGMGQFLDVQAHLLTAYLTQRADSAESDSLVHVGPPTAPPAAVLAAAEAPLAPAVDAIAEAVVVPADARTPDVTPDVPAPGIGEPDLT